MTVVSSPVDSTLGVVVLVRDGTEVARWPMAASPLRAGARCTVDLAVVDRLARLQLSATRIGCRVRVLEASADLAELLRFVGLYDRLVDDGA